MPAPSTRPAPKPMPQPQVQPKTQQQTDAPPMTRTQTREKEEVCKSDDQDCLECPPEQGMMAIANDGKGHSMSDLSARYQHWVTNFPYPHEWLWSGTWWDGFDKSRCTLLEAKANYAFMFIPILNEPRLWSGIEEKLLIPAKNQSKKAQPTPPVWVEWHFLQKNVYEYCTEQFMELGLVNIKTFWNPMPGSKDHQEYEELRQEEEKQWNEYIKNNPDLIA
ncbi:Tox-REase-5 domain-containing protein [Metapseudomonas otitidis]|uniref:Tox-REase-5 domain-containing protein n=1 Tax=Metapseudomonas otitidis TaxID=319939 RepID=UPI003EE396E8